MITGPLCKAGRSLVEVTRAKLARNADVEESVIENFERGIDTPDDGVIIALQKSFKELGKMTP